MPGPVRTKKASAQRYSLWCGCYQTKLAAQLLADRARRRALGLLQLAATAQPVRLHKHFRETPPPARLPGPPPPRLAADLRLTNLGKLIGKSLALHGHPCPRRRPAAGSSERCVPLSRRCRRCDRGFSGRDGGLLAPGWLTLAACDGSAYLGLRPPCNGSASACGPCLGGSSGRGIGAKAPACRIHCRPVPACCWIRSAGRGACWRLQRPKAELPADRQLCPRPSRPICPNLGAACLACGGWCDPRRRGSNQPQSERTDSHL